MCVCWVILLYIQAFFNSFINKDVTCLARKGKEVTYSDNIEYKREFVSQGASDER
jgi:hypothetical protein